LNPIKQRKLGPKRLKTMPGKVKLMILLLFLVLKNPLVFLLDWEWDIEMKLKIFLPLALVHQV